MMKGRNDLSWHVLRLSRFVEARQAARSTPDTPMIHQASNTGKQLRSNAAIVCLIVSLQLIFLLC